MVACRIRGNMLCFHTHGRSDLGAAGARNKRLKGQNSLHSYPERQGPGPATEAKENVRMGGGARREDAAVQGGIIASVPWGRRGPQAPCSFQTSLRTGSRLHTALKGFSITPSNDCASAGPSPSNPRRRKHSIEPHLNGCFRLLVRVQFQNGEFVGYLLTRRLPGQSHACFFQSFVRGSSCAAELLAQRFVLPFNGIDSLAPQLRR